MIRESEEVIPTGKLRSNPQETWRQLSLCVSVSAFALCCSCFLYLLTPAISHRFQVLLAPKDCCLSEDFPGSWAEAFFSVPLLFGPQGRLPQFSTLLAQISNTFDSHTSRKEGKVL